MSQGNFNRAFTALRKMGILAKQNFLCCQNCGGTALDAEASKKRNVIGYVFYHNQDNERKVKGESFYLAYGTFSDALSGQQVGRLVCEVLKLSGVKVRWSGQSSERIQVVGWTQGEEQ